MQLNNKMDKDMMADKSITYLRYLLYNYDVDMETYIVTLTKDNIKEKTLNLSKKINEYIDSINKIIEKDQNNENLEEEVKIFDVWRLNKVSGFLKVVSKYAIDTNDNELIELVSTIYSQYTEDSPNNEKYFNDIEAIKRQTVKPKRKPFSSSRMTQQRQGFALKSKALKE